MRRWLGMARGNGAAITMGTIGIVLLGSALVGDRGLARISLLRGELRVASDQNFQLLQTLSRTRRELHAIRTDDGALERIARERLRLVREGETLYRVESLKGKGG